MEKVRVAENMAGLDILATGRRTQTVQSKLKHWRTFNAYALVYICEGSGSFESNETAEIDVKAGDCFFLFPGVSHFYGPPGQNLWKEIWVLFNGNIAGHMLKEKAFNPASPVVRIHATRRTDFQSNLESLTDTFKNRSSDYRLHCTALFYKCLLQSTLPLDSPPPISEDSILLDEMKLILRRNIGNNRKIPTFFQSSKYSYNTIRMEFQRLTGQSPGQYLNDLRMQHAEEQLLWSGLSITKICSGLGFSDSRYFSTAFKKYSGSSPTEFRQRYHLIRQA
jgi:AraC-like DNA-binding protein